MRTVPRELAPSARFYGTLSARRQKTRPNRQSGVAHSQLREPFSARLNTGTNMVAFHIRITMLADITFLQHGRTTARAAMTQYAVAALV
jgi:hypothetical protein